MARLVEDDLRSYYHCVSRVVDGRYIFGDEEKRFFRKTMRGLEHLTGVRILTSCLAHELAFLVAGKWVAGKWGRVQCGKIVVRPNSLCYSY